MRTASGLYLPPQKKKYSCPYELDERLEQDLVNLNQQLYRSIQRFLGTTANIKVAKATYFGKQLLPDAVQVWTLYCGALIAGAADAALTLSLHNMGREARILERQIFEYVMKAWYFKRHPRAARRELETFPFRDLHFLEQARFDRRKKRFRDVEKMCRALRISRPALARYAKRTANKEAPSVKDTIPRRKGSKELTAEYTRAYRWPSLTMHASVLGMAEVIKEEGIQFDSRLDDPNYTILFTSRFIMTFLTIVNDVFSLSRDSDIEKLNNELVKIEDRLLEGYGD
jgi:hypothetical protein